MSMTRSLRPDPARMLRHGPATGAHLPTCAVPDEASAGRVHPQDPGIDTCSPRSRNARDPASRQPARTLEKAPRQIPVPIDIGLRWCRSVDDAGRRPSAAAPHTGPQAATRPPGRRWRPLLPLMLGALLASTGPVHAGAVPAPDSAPPLIRLAEATPATATSPSTTPSTATAQTTAARTAPTTAPATATATAPSTATSGTAAPGPTTDDPAADDPSRLPLDDDGLPPNAEAIMRSPRFRHLAHELRCLVCQNQTLLDSHAPLAQDLRHEVVRLMARGMDDAQVRQHLVDRYGEFVLYRPSWSWRNAVLWLGPALMLLAAGLVAWRVLSRRGHALQGASGHVGGDEVGDQAPLASTDARTEVGRAREALRQVDALLDPDHDPDRDKGHKGRRHG